MSHGEHANDGVDEPGTSDMSQVPKPAACGLRLAACGLQGLTGALPGEHPTKVDQLTN